MGTQAADLHEHPVTCVNGTVSDTFKSRHSPHADLRVSRGGPGRVHVTYTVRALLALVAALATFAIAAPSTAQQGPARWDKPVLTVHVVFCRELYASVSLFVCTLFLALRAAGIDADLNTLLCFALGFAFRMLAIRLGWKLPTFSYQQRWD